MGSSELVWVGCVGVSGVVRVGWLSIFSRDSWAGKLVLGGCFWGAHGRWVGCLYVHLFCIHMNLVKFMFFCNVDI